MDVKSVAIGDDGRFSAARISITAANGGILYDRFIRQKEEVSDYRVAVTGIKSGDLKSFQAVQFEDALREVHAIVNDRVIIGYNLANQMKILMLRHENFLVRDISTYKPFQLNFKPRKLVSLAKDILNLDIQVRVNSSVEDARICFNLYKTVRDQWEASIDSKFSLKLRELRKKIARDEVSVMKQAAALEVSAQNRKARQARRAERRKASSGGRWLTEGGNDDEGDDNDTEKTRSKSKYDDDDSDSD